MINPLSLVPSWAYLAAIVGLTGLVGVQQVRVSALKTEIADEKGSRELENGKRLRMALDHEQEISKLKDAHVAAQTERDGEYGKQILALKSSNALHVADAGRLRSKLAAFTASDRQPGETDAAACERARNRLPLVGDLLAEGIELEAESRDLIQRRDAEVALLLDQIKIDRAACSAP